MLATSAETQHAFRRQMLAQLFQFCSGGLDSNLRNPRFSMLFMCRRFFVSGGGRSNWLSGAQLVAAYVLIAIVYLFRDSK